MSVCFCYGLFFFLFLLFAQDREPDGSETVDGGVVMRPPQLARVHIFFFFACVCLSLSKRTYASLLYRLGARLFVSASK